MLFFSQQIINNPGNSSGSNLRKCHGGDFWLFMSLWNKITGERINSKQLRSAKKESEMIRILIKDTGNRCYRESGDLVRVSS